MLSAFASLQALRLRLQYAPRAELFATLLHQWEASGSSERSVRFLRAVAAGGLESQMRGHFLQLNAEDVLAGLTRLSEAVLSGTSELTSGDVQEMAITWGALVEVAVLTAFAADPRRDLRQGKLDGALEEYRAVAGCLSSGFAAENIRGDDDQAWKVFEAIPFEMDAGFKSTKDARAISEAADRITQQQDRELKMFLQSSGREDQGFQETAITAGALWETVSTLTKWLQAYSLKQHSDETSCCVDEGETVSRDDCFALELVCSDAKLEEYIAGGKYSSQALKPREKIASKLKQTAVQCLLEYEIEDAPIDGTFDLAASARDELFQENNLEALRVKITYLLVHQLESKVCFLPYDSHMATTFERQIQRIINSLTDDKSKCETHKKTLLVLSAFTPDKLIRLVVQRARESDRHHVFYVDILRCSPLLIEWEGESSDIPMIIRTFQQEIDDIASHTELFEPQSSNIVSFIWLLTAHSCEDLLLSIDEVLEDVFIPILTRISSVPTSSIASTTSAIRILSMVHRLVEQLVTGNPTQIASIKQSAPKIFKFAVNSYADVSKLKDSTLGSVHQREVVLLLVKDLLALWFAEGDVSEIRGAVSTICEQVEIDVAFETLLSVAGALASSRLDTSVDETDRSSTLGRFKSEKLLWEIFWSLQMLSKPQTNSAVTTVSELWSRLDNTAAEEFSDSDRTVSGANVVISAATLVLLNCGEKLFAALCKQVLPFLMKYEPVDIAMRGAYVLSAVSVQQLGGSNAGACEPASRSRNCFSISPHAEARYLLKCWTLAALDKEKQSREMLLDFLRGVLGACDSAVAASSGSHLLLLLCFQYQCYIGYSLHKLKLDDETLATPVCSMLEMSMLRTLHSLAAFKSLPEDEQHFVRAFIAGWLAIVRSDGFLRSVFQYLAVNNSRAG